jgi:hypothetical protein
VSKRADAYRQLVERYGEGRVADALLAKWRADPEGDAAFNRLAVRIMGYRRHAGMSLSQPPDKNEMAA